MTLLTAIKETAQCMPLNVLTVSLQSRVSQKKSQNQNGTGELTMREILFRGKLIATGEWAYGNLNRTIKGTNIITPDETLIGKYGAVIPETVGQYTGLTDKNGKKIFEGDIVQATITYNNFPHDRVDNKTAIFEIKYHEKHCYFYLAKKNYNMLFDGNWSYYLKEIEIIGNIHDNPELLKEGTDNGNVVS
jgi:uncharacterized phage protein (TIGR01671 family)